MPTMSMLMLKGKAYREQIKLKNKYLNKSIYIYKGHLAIVYHVHKVQHGWLYCYKGNKEIRFKPQDVTI